MRTARWILAALMLVPLLGCGNGPTAPDKPRTGTTPVVGPPVTPVPPANPAPEPPEDPCDLHPTQARCR